MLGRLNRSGISALAFLLLSVAQPPYSEPYRPQYHFSPVTGWIGDPDGLIRYKNTYHLFWWGHAISSDLIHWKQLPKPMRGDDGSFAYFSGSVVVDRGTNPPPMVAVYTAHKRTGDSETQCISSSLEYTNFDYYAGNPVLDIGSASFRDPDVFWDAERKRWCMVVVLPE